MSKYKCKECGKDLRQRRKTSLCKTCLHIAQCVETDLAIFRAIVKFKTENEGFSPKVPQIVAMAHFDESTVKVSLRRLEQRGKIVIIGSRHRFGIRVFGGQWKFTGRLDFSREEPIPQIEEE